MDPTVGRGLAWMWHITTFKYLTKSAKVVVRDMQTVLLLKVFALLNHGTKTKKKIKKLFLGTGGHLLSTEEGPRGRRHSLVATWIRVAGVGGPARQRARARARRVEGAAAALPWCPVSGGTGSC